MAAKVSPYRDMVETRVFVHWLRTGVRADAEQLIDLVERKFNPYHDEIGRFTSPPGVTVSYGSPVAPGSNRTILRGPFARNTAASAGNSARTRTAPGPRTRAAGQSRDTSSENGFHSALVRNSVLQTTSNADSYFELNQRQAHLNNLRRQAGPNPAPAVRADLDDFQSRLDYNRTILAERAKIADAEVFKLLRMGNAPVDIGAGLVNIARSQAELNDYLAVAGAIPVAGVVSKVGRFAKVAKESIPLVHGGKQGKHVVGHNTYIVGRSVLTADPHVLARRAGTGTPANSVPRGQAGFKERVDFGEIIGEYVAKGKSSPTTIGILNYDKSGKIHIVPGRPKS